MQIRQEEFIKLYDENVDAIYRYVFLRVSSVELAQDLTSEVFLRSWQYANNEELTDDIRAIRNPRPFFYRIARNLIIDFYRQKSRTEISLEDYQESQEIPDLSQDPAERTSLALELAPIRQALSKIDDERADVIIWRYLDDLSVPEIAKILDKSEGAVRVMLSRGLNQVKELVES